MLPIWKFNSKEAAKGRDTWEFRYYESTEKGGRRRKSCIVGTVACLHPDDDEHLWTGYVVIEERSEWEGCRDGAQADFGERLKRQFSYWEILGVGR